MVWRCYTSFKKGQRRRDPVIMLQDQGSGTSFPVLYWENSIGRSRSCDITLPDVPPLPGCRCGQVLKGRITPPQCPLFGKACTPASPVGPCMVSTEGSCAAYFKYMT